MLLAHGLHQKPLDLVAAELGVSRDAVYKAIHDARRKLRGALLARGLTLPDALKALEGQDRAGLDHLTGMAMTPERLRQIMRTIYGAEERQIVCSEFFDRLPAYVDLQLAGEASGAVAERAMPDVAHYIAQCPECGEAYQALVTVARAGK